MFDTIILLTGAAEQPALAAALIGHRSDLSIYPATISEDLLAIPSGVLPHARLVAFASPVIVPATILGQLGYGACNFHPGPPEFPGFRPAQYAVYLGAPRFGATAHMMAERVDEGPIFDYVHFDVSPGSSVAALERQSFQQIAMLFWRNAAQLASAETSPQPLPIRWNAIKTTRQKYRALSTVTTDIDADELQRRVAAFGDGEFGIRLTLDLHGVRFIHEEREG